MKLCAFGECLIDFTPYGVSEQGNILFERNPGGAPCNLAVACQRLGMEASFIGKVGDDMFGDFLIKTLRQEQVDTQYMVRSSVYKTTLAFVELEDGERSFCFFRNPGADVTVETREVNFQAIDECDIFHVGSVSMTHNPSRTTTFELLDYAKKKGKLISYDPNLRELLWASLDEARHVIRKGIPYCQILKVSEEELVFLTAEKDQKEGAKKLFHEFRTPLILVTSGKQGSAAYYRNEWIEVASFEVNAVDTTGAGDGFFGCFLSEFMKSHKSLEQLSHEEIAEMLKRSNAVGALTTSKKGAIPALPYPEEVALLMKRQG